MNDLIAFLRARLDEDEAVARAAAKHVSAPPNPGLEWRRDWDKVFTAPSNPPGPRSQVADCGYGGGDLTAHVALHDPAAVLRRVAADRELLADLLAEKHQVVDGDCWYTCTAATEEHDGGENCDDNRHGDPCDCGRDTRVHRRIQILAESYGWTAN